ncbi:hypothetical protein SAMN05880590_11193 [Rhizobium sp. RU35A]|uniref:hypothetical protein n=1 Tax=Rhizobium sp. RU35A TaxID=1907414 RepID=UPI00095576F4|nr:hypothetical protein SAMN05880590_11193 [Rhizobium sp. RU35A]
MGSINEPMRRNDAKSYTAQIRVRREGRIVHSEAQTFARYGVASAWLKKRKTELAEPGALEALHAPGVTVDDVIEKYLQTERRGVGRSKAQVLETIRKHPLSLMRCEKITSVEICAFAEDLLEGWVPDGREARPRKPQTVGHYLSTSARCSPSRGRCGAIRWIATPFRMLSPSISAWVL